MGMFWVTFSVRYLKTLFTRDVIHMLCIYTHLNMVFLAHPPPFGSNYIVLWKFRFFWRRERRTSQLGHIFSLKNASHSHVFTFHTICQNKLKSTPSTEKKPKAFPFLFCISSWGLGRGPL